MHLPVHCGQLFSKISAVEMEMNAYQGKLKRGILGESNLYGENIRKDQSIGLESGLVPKIETGKRKYTLAGYIMHAIPQKVGSP